MSENELSVQAFSSALNELEGYLPANRLMLSIPALPRTVVARVGNLRNVQMWCSHSSLPGFSIATADTYTPHGMGAIRKVPWTAVTSDVDIRVLADSKGVMHEFFRVWSTSVVRHGGQDLPQFFVNYPADYSTTVEISSLDTTNKKVITAKLLKAWPLFVSEIQGDWGATNSAAYFTVKLNYFRHEFLYPKNNPNTER